MTETSGILATLQADMEIGDACTLSGELSGDPRWQLTLRIAESRSMGRSALLAKFLLYISDRYLCERVEEITEQKIGVHVFGRAPGYNSTDDNIVRNYARTLRKRIEEYYAKEGRREPFNLTIPRGGYVPVFSPRLSEAEPCGLDMEIPELLDPLESIGPRARDHVAPLTRPVVMDSLLSTTFVSEQTGGIPASLNSPAVRLSDSTGVVPSPAWGRRHFLAFTALATILLSVLGGYVGAHGLPAHWISHESAAGRINRIFWSRMFEEKRDTFLVPADGGLVMLQSFMKEHASLEDYASGSYQRQAQIAQGIGGLIKGRTAEDDGRLVNKVEVLARRRYTSMADLELTTHLARLKEVVPERLMIRYARDVRMDDLRTGNVVLMGSIDANPWVELFQRQLNFKFLHGADFGGSGIITNQHPLPGEQSTYASEAHDPLLRTYGVIAYLPNLDGTGHALLIEGVNMAATQAAGEFLLDEDQMRPVLERAIGANGAIRTFEVLLQTDNIAANASRPHVLSERIEPE